MPIRSVLRHPLLFLLTLFLLIAGCGPDKQQKALRASLTAVNSARSGFVAWDQFQQATIVDKATSLEDGRAALAQYRQKRERVLSAFETAYKVLAVAAIDPTDANLRTLATAVFDMLAQIELLRGASPAPAPRASFMPALLPLPLPPPAPRLIPILTLPSAYAFPEVVAHG